MFCWLAVLTSKSFLTLHCVRQSDNSAVKDGQRLVDYVPYVPRQTLNFKLQLLLEVRSYAYLPFLVEPSAHDICSTELQASYLIRDDSILLASCTTSNAEKESRTPFLVKQDSSWLKEEAGCKPFINVTTSHGKQGAMTDSAHTSRTVAAAGRESR